MKSLAIRSLVAVILCSSALSVVAQTPATKAVKAVPAAPVVEALELKSYVLAKLDMSDLSQNYTAIFSKLAGKEQAVPKFSLVAKSKTFFVRGSKAQLEISDAVVLLLQADAANPKGQQVIALKHSRSDEIIATLQALDLQDQVIAMRASNAIVVLPTSEANALQIAKVIEVAEKASLPIKAAPGTKVPVKTGG